VGASISSCLTLLHLCCLLSGLLLLCSNPRLLFLFPCCVFGFLLSFLSLLLSLFSTLQLLDLPLIFLSFFLFLLKLLLQFFLPRYSELVSTLGPPTAQTLDKGKVGMNLETAFPSRNLAKDWVQGRKVVQESLM